MRSGSEILKIGIGLCLCAHIAGSLEAGEKIQFSSRNGAPAKPDTNTPAKREFQAPDFRGVTRYRKDPLEGVVETQSTATFPSARDKAKNRRRDGLGREEEKDGLAMDDRTDSDRDDSDDRDSDSSSSRDRDRDRKDSNSSRDGDRRGREDARALSMMGTNRISIDVSRPSNGLGNTFSRPGMSQNQGAEPNNPFAWASGNGSFSQPNSRGYFGAGEPVTPGNMRLEMGGRMWEKPGGPALPGFLKGPDGGMSDRSGAKSSLSQSGPGLGGSFGSALNGPGKLNDFNSMMPAGSSKPSAPAAPEPPRFDAKPAVLEIPKRKF